MFFTDRNGAPWTKPDRFREAFNRLRTLRHTCLTFNYDAGVPPELIPGITGHSADEIEDILKHYARAPPTRPPPRCSCGWTTKRRERRHERPP